MCNIKQLWVPAILVIQPCGPYSPANSLLFPWLMSPVDLQYYVMLFIHVSQGDCEVCMFSQLDETLGHFCSWILIILVHPLSVLNVSCPSLRDNCFSMPYSFFSVCLLSLIWDCCSFHIIIWMARPSKKFMPSPRFPYFDCLLVKNV